MDVDALLAEYLGPVQRQFDRDLLLQRQLHKTELDVTSADRTVKISLTCAGEIIDIEFAPGALGKHTERSLAETLKNAIKAGREAGRKAAEQMTEKAIREREARYGK